jgi:exonuclease VII small subunit
MKDPVCRLFVCLMLFSLLRTLEGQSAPQAVASSSSLGSEGGAVQLEQRLENISTALDTTRQQLEQSQQQIKELQEELAQVRKQLSATTSQSANTSTSGDSQTAKDSDLQDRVEALEAQVKLHDQTKVETSSKYPVRINGLILLNGFINRGAVDNLDLPSIAVRSSTDSSGSGGATMRQTILGIQAFGPRIAGARTSADISFDFYGGIPYSNFGTAAGVLRMRTAGIHLNWQRDLLEGGMEAPLISPLSPTSYATVGEPGLAWAGNLWTWAPQLRYAHQFVGAKEQHIQLEFGLWDPPQAGYNSTDVFRTPSAGERSSQPAYETRVSYGASDAEHALQVGLSGYYSRQKYPVMTSAASTSSYLESNDSWTFAADWRVPLAHRFEVSGEGYRGRSLGGLGGGVYKDVLYGTDPVTGAPEIRGVNAIGGWTQLKSKFGGLLEANASIGLDNGFAQDFHAIVLPPTASATQLRARNRMVVGNLIYRPKTYLILSPEYRRIWTWPISSTRNTADIFTLSVGYQF